MRVSIPTSRRGSFSVLAVEAAAELSDSVLLADVEVLIDIANDGAVEETDEQSNEQRAMMKVGKESGEGGQG